MNFSVLIPIYNQDVTKLTVSILDQARLLSSTFEVILIDDCSDTSYQEKNRSIQNHPEITYFELTQNIGRARIRNLLFEKAQYNACIVLDCDVEIVRDDFIKKYLSTLRNTDVVVGGHIYSSLPPKDPDLYLHWLYGTKKEIRSVKNRSKKPYSSFKTSAFAIRKTLFSSILFNEKLTQYGHEDTLFGYELKQRGILIAHIDNPVLHAGLEPQNLFIQKQFLAVQNLMTLHQKGYQEALKTASSLYRIFLWLQKTRILYLAYPIFHIIRKKPLKKRPSIFYIQLLKLAELSIVYIQQKSL